jgi:uncharacterized protein (DUF1697 family)
MTRVVVLLRGVNVGGRNRVAMADLRALLERLGGRGVRTYVNSGNAVLEADAEGLEERVAAALRAELDLDVGVVVRTADEVAAVVEACPFEDPDPTGVHVVFLGGPAPELDVTALLPDEVVVRERELYVRYAAGVQDSPAAKVLLSKRFPVVATSRNWRTVNALAGLLRG